MAVNRRGIVIEIIGDERSYLRAAETTIGANTKLDSSFRRVGVNAKASADAQVAAAVKASEALRINAAQLGASASRLPAGAGRDAALVAAAAAQDKYNRSIGVSTASSERFSKASQTAERDLGKATRGALAGTGAVVGLGRSLAFASGGFLAFAGGTTLIRNSIQGAEQLEKAQTGLSVAIQKTGGNLAKLEPRYAATAKRAEEFGINQADALTGLERATVLTGDAAKAQRAYQEALVISKATGKDFNAVLTATSKGQEGITTSLQRYGIRIAKGTSGTEQFVTVMSRFAGQAKANTSQSERFNATLANSEEIIGTALLPTFNRYLGQFGSWLDKMNKSGRLQKDVNGVLHVASDAFHVLGDAIGVVDKVTGSFKNTLELLLAGFAISKVVAFGNAIAGLAGKWGLVRTAAIEATAAETAAGAGAGAAGAGGGIVAAGRFAGKAAAIEAAAPFAPFLAIPAIASLSPVRGPKSLKIFGYTSEGQPMAAGSDGNYYAVGARGYLQVSKAQALSVASFAGVRGAPVITKEAQSFPRTGNIIPGAFQAPGFQPPPPPRTAAASGLFGGVQPIPVFKSFQLTGLEQLAQARASLTRANADDVAAAKGVIARIKRLIDKGHLAGNSLIQALQAEASALGTIWSAEDAAAQKRAQRAAAAKARIQQQLQDSIDPLNLEIALSRAQAFGKPILPRLRALLRAAENALAKGLTGALEKQALDQITSLKQQIAQARTTATVTFAAPARLQLALAKDAALGISPTKDLLKLKAGILKFIRTHKHNIAALTDAYNQLTAVDQQLGSTAQSALGLFKQASTRALTAGLSSLSAADRERLRARLSQLGPGGTVPGSGVGAAGFVIDPRTDRPQIIHTHVHLGEREVGRSVTKVQQKHRRRNPGQRRGPNAGMAGT